MWPLTIHHEGISASSLDIRHLSRRRWSFHTTFVDIRCISAHLTDKPHPTTGDTPPHLQTFTWRCTGCTDLRSLNHQFPLTTVQRSMSRDKWCSVCPISDPLTRNVKFPIVFVVSAFTDSVFSAVGSTNYRDFPNKQHFSLRQDNSSLRKSSESISEDLSSMPANSHVFELLSRAFHLKFLGS